MKKQLACYIFFCLALCLSHNSQAQRTLSDTAIAAPVAATDAESTGNEIPQHKNIFTPVSRDTIAYQQKQLPHGFTARLKNDKAFAYVKDGLPEQQNGQGIKWHIPGFVVYLLFAILIGLITWYLAANNMLIFKSNTNVNTAAAEEEINTDNIFEINYQLAIEKAIANKNYRMAVRLQYLQVLKMLANRNIIQYHPDKTNHEYLFQLRGSKHYDPFYMLTRNYEYSWYGLFEVDEVKYQAINNTFRNFEKNIR